MPDPYDALVPAPAIPGQDPRLQKMIREVLHGTFVEPVQQAGQALRGELTDQGAQDFAAQAAMGILPMRAVGGAIKPIAKGIRTWHASPHDFDKFDISKIGTGQGANTYGKGIYLAENPAVSGPGGEYWWEFLRHLPEHQQQAGSRMAHHRFDRDKAIAEAQKNLAELRQYSGPLGPDWRAPRASDREDMSKLIKMREDELRALEDRGGQAGPRVYEVDINAKPEQLLDWDAPMAKQPHVMEALSGSRDPSVREVMRRLDLQDMPGARGEVGLKPVTGEDFYTELKHGVRGRGANASDVLNDTGVPGARYLDAGSRSAAGDVATMERAYENTQRRLLSREPGVTQEHVDAAKLRYENALERHGPDMTRNYVMYNDNLLGIMKKLGLAGGLIPFMGLGGEQSTQKGM